MAVNSSKNNAFMPVQFKSTFGDFETLGCLDCLIGTIVHLPNKLFLEMVSEEIEKEVEDEDE